MDVRDRDVILPLALRRYNILCEEREKDLH